MLILIVYDIPDDKRRQKLAMFLEGYGQRMQWSVFECFISLPEMKQLYEKVKRRVNLDENNVRFYWIAADCVPRALTIGSPPLEPPPRLYIV